MFNPAQHGFRKGLSCVTQLTEFTHDIAESLDHRLSVDCAFLDFQKAFDTVPHASLIEKLGAYSIHPQVISWIRSYLASRKQFVIVNGAQSQIGSVTSGVPQGSVLGPLLFLLYINDITDGIQSQMHLFADDCVLYREVKCIDDVAVLQQDLEKINEWCTKWHMKLNAKKTVYMTFTRKKYPHTSSYNLNSVPLKQVSDYKYLGVYFTSFLRWQRHVDYVAAKAGKVLGFLRRNAKTFPVPTKELLYKTNVRPLLEYACTVWDPPAKRDIDKLESIQNLAARFVSGNYCRTIGAESIKETLNWEHLDNRRRKMRLKFFHAVYHGCVGIENTKYLLAPHYVSDRVDHMFKVREIACKTDLFRLSFFPRTIREWNQLPSNIASYV